MYTFKCKKYGRGRLSAIKDWFQCFHSVNSGQHVIEYVQKDRMELFENLHSGNAKQLHHFVKSHDVIVGGANNHSRDR